jgi:hypothetical protein
MSICLPNILKNSPSIIPILNISKNVIAIDPIAILANASNLLLFLS